VGDVAARKLLAAWGSPQAVFAQSAAVLTQVVSPAQAQALQQPPSDWAEQVTRAWQWLGEAAPDQPPRRLITLADPHYPQALLNLSDPPLLLYLLGRGFFEGNSAIAPVKLAQADTVSIANSSAISSQRCLAVVGSRNPTPQGQANAQQFAQALAEQGWTIVSGMALGVDGAAHTGALQAAAQRPGAALTVAVVGTGLDRVYPSAHRKLAHQITEHGLLLSEYPIGTPPHPANFPKRNRLIAALARGTLVVEATLKSGSLITARLSAELGREVLAIPGSIHAAQSRGCHALIKQGAKLVECAQDILDELPDLGQTALPSAPVSIADSVYDTRATGQNDSGNRVLAALAFDPVSLDALQARCGLSGAELQAELMTLELAGEVARLPGGLFQRQA
jgi:DNA processing protein